MKQIEVFLQQTRKRFARRKAIFALKHLNTMNKSFFRIIALIFFLMVSVVGMAQNRSETKAAQARWVGTFATAPEFTGQGDMPQTTSLAGNTLRQVVRVSIGGQKLRLQFSNLFSEEPLEIKSVYIADAADSSNIVKGTATYLKFHGRRSITLSAGKEVYSDAFNYRLKPLQRLAVTIVYGDKVPKNATSHRGSRTHSFIAKGEVKPRSAFRSVERPVHWYNLTRVEVLSSQAEAVAILGNSITDGRGSTTDAQNRWPDFMMMALDDQARQQGRENHMAVLNLGIGGNCVVRGGISQPGLKRFERDILSQNGVKKVIVFEGTNDIGTSKGNSEQVAADLIEAYKSFAEKAHFKGWKIYGATITPTKGNGWYSLFHEAARQTVNEWIRTSGVFDGVIDFDELVRDPADPQRLRAEYSDDWLHLNPKGYEAMGKYAAKVMAEAE
jgi:lysophospholipase L1-like esterase